MVSRFNHQRKNLQSQKEEEILIYQHRLKTNSNSFAFLPLAKAYCRLNRFSEAIKICSGALAVHKDYPPAHVVMGQAYMSLGKLTKALKHLEFAIKQAPNNLLAGRLLGQIYMKQGRLEKAIKIYQATLNYHPECTDLKGEVEQLRTGKRLKYRKILLELERLLKNIKTYGAKAA